MVGSGVVRRGPREVERGVQSPLVAPHPLNSRARWRDSPTELLREALIEWRIVAENANVRRRISADGRRGRRKTQLPVSCDLDERLRWRVGQGNQRSCLFKLRAVLEESDAGVSVAA
jgi:hypothetical protein